MGSGDLSEVVVIAPHFLLHRCVHEDILESGGGGGGGGGARIGYDTGVVCNTDDRGHPNNCST